MIKHAVCHTKERRPRQQIEGPKNTGNHCKKPRGKNELNKKSWRGWV